MITIPEKPDYSFYKPYTDQLTHKQCVIFALYCAEISLDLLKDKSELEEKAKICIDLVKQWLEDTNNVTQEQLRNAAVDAADAAVDAADANAANASSAAYAAAASAAAWAATAAAWAATNAAAVAAYAAAANASSAAYAADTAWAAAAVSAPYATDTSWAAVHTTAAKIKIIPYLSSLISVKLPSIKYNDPLEQLVYYTDQLNIQLLIPIKNGYKLNLWDKSYEYQIEGTIEEIANTKGVKYLLRGIQNDNNS